MAHTQPLLLVLFLTVWAMMMGSYLYFCWYVVPSALRRWAAKQSYQITEQKRAGIFDWFSFAEGSGHWIYRVVILDEAGQTRSGLVRVGYPYRWCLSSSRCPADVRWDPPAAFSRKAVTRRTVLYFAAADLILATLVLAMELGLLFVLAIGADEIFKGSLGVNRYFGRVPRLDAIEDTQLVMAQFLGLFALYLPALVALTAGGIGLILRKTWGYYSHVAGSALVAVTCFGVIYTILALAVALRPEFKEYFRGTEKPKQASDFLEDL